MLQYTAYVNKRDLECGSQWVLKKWVKGLFGGKSDSAMGAVDYNIDKDLFYKILDTDPCAILFFTKESGWIGANKAFFP